MVKDTHVEIINDDVLFATCKDYLSDVHIFLNNKDNADETLLQLD